MKGFTKKQQKKKQKTKKNSTKNIKQRRKTGNSHYIQRKREKLSKIKQSTKIISN